MYGNMNKKNEIIIINRNEYRNEYRREEVDRSV